MKGNCFVIGLSSVIMASNAALDNLKKAMKENDKSVDDLFKELDVDGDGKINGPELYKGIKSMVGELMSLDQVSDFIKSYDIDGDNRIAVSELRSALS